LFNNQMLLFNETLAYIKDMATLYVIGGPARCGKTSAMRQFLKKRPMYHIATDTVRFGVRYLLLKEAFVSVTNLNFVGQATFHRPGSLKKYTRRFAQRIDNENELAWQATIGMIDHFDRLNKDLAVEGIYFKPRHIKMLKLKNLNVRAAFVGFTDKRHFRTILEHAKRDPEDWINLWLDEIKQDLNVVNRWIRKQIANSRTIKTEAKRCGFGYFDVTKKNYSKHVRDVCDYLLAK
jgi:2-phosphoglycerate kinase